MYSTYAQRIQRSLLLGLCLSLCGTAAQASFTAGDVVVYRVGDGSSALVNTGNAVFMDEYTPAGVLVQSVPLPTTAAGAQHQLIASGTASSEGMLTRSADGRYLVLSGYAADLGGATSLSGSAAAMIPRTVGRVKFDESIDTSTALTDFSDANNPRSATSTTGTDLWVGGAAGGVRYTTLGSTTSTQLSTDSTNIRQVSIFDGQLYISSQKGSIRVATVGGGVPTTAGQAITNLPGTPSTGAPDAFFLATLNGGPDVDTLYVADDGLGQILKYSLEGDGNWHAKGQIVAANVHGVTGTVSGMSVTLFASGTTGTDGTLYTFVDGTGFDATVSGSATMLVSAPANETFRGVALAPVVSLLPTPTPTGPTPTVTLTPTATETPTPLPPPVPFTAGDLVIYRVGDGDATLTSTGNPVFLDEYSPTGMLVQSIELPTASDGTNNPLIASGTAKSEGLLTLSLDGQFLLLTGYDASPGGATALGSSAAAMIPRTVGRVAFDGAIDTTTALTDFADLMNARSAASTDGTNLWVGGQAGGVRYATLGSTTSLELSTDTEDVEQVAIFDGQLYASLRGDASAILGTVGTGTPTMSGQSITGLPAFPTTGSPYAFFFADLDGAPGLDTLYVADDTTGGGQIQKYSLVSGSWTASGEIDAANVRGLTGVVVGPNVTLYATTSGSSGASGVLYTFTDSAGFNAAVSGPATTLVTAPVNEAYRGVALVPGSSGLVPPDKATGKCEDGAGKGLGKLAPCVLKCQIKNGSALLDAKTFDDTACVQDPSKSCREKYDKGGGKLSGCPACLDPTAQDSLADSLISFLEENTGQIYCAGTTPLGGSGGGFVPPDKDTNKCEGAVAKNLGKLAKCVMKCHTKLADAALKASSFDEVACEQAPGKSCRASYDAASSALVATCPPCLDATAQGNLADSLVAFLRGKNGRVYCAGTVPLP